MIGTIGFGILHVSGRSRVPNPPAIITAFIIDLVCSMMKKSVKYKPNAEENQGNRTRAS
jgi:hypothetical protein